MSNNVYSFTLQTAQVTTGTPETVCNDATAQNPLGALIKWGDNVYRYCQYNSGSGTVASAAAGVCHWKTLTIVAGPVTTPVYTVTGDQTDAIATLFSVAGIAKGVVTTLYYSWFGVGGMHSCSVAASTTVGDTMIGSVTDLTFQRIASGVGSATSAGIYGSAYSAVAATVSNVLLQNLIW